MKKWSVLVVLLALLLTGCHEPPPQELIDEETILILALEEAKEYVPLGLQTDMATCELDEVQRLYRITFEPDAHGRKVTVLIDSVTGETVDVLLGD